MRTPTSALLEAVTTMSPRQHWPDQSQPFDIQQSQITRWLQKQPDVMQWLFDTLRQRRLIVYDPETFTWRGRDWKGRRGP